MADRSDDDMKLELSKILAKTMQASYKKKELEEVMLRVMGKVSKLVDSEHTAEYAAKLRNELEEIRKGFYGL